MLVLLVITSCPPDDAAYGQPDQPDVADVRFAHVEPAVRHRSVRAVLPVARGPRAGGHLRRRGLLVFDRRLMAHVWRVLPASLRRHPLHARGPLRPVGFHSPAGLLAAVHSARHGGRGGRHDRAVVSALGAHVSGGGPTRVQLHVLWRRPGWRLLHSLASNLDARGHRLGDVRCCGGRGAGGFRAARLFARRAAVQRGRAAGALCHEVAHRHHANSRHAVHSAVAREGLFQFHSGLAHLSPTSVFRQSTAPSWASASSPRASMAI